jgi:hypothetical protein
MFPTIIMVRLRPVLMATIHIPRMHALRTATTVLGGFQEGSSSVLVRGTTVATGAEAITAAADFMEVDGTEVAPTAVVDSMVEAATAADGDENIFAKLILLTQGVRNG